VRDLLEWDQIEALSMACPALPLCGLAIAEAERALPDFNARIRVLLDRLGFAKEEKFVVRATGEWPCLPAWGRMRRCGWMLWQARQRSESSTSA
jgi:hypothetical protein